MADFGLVYKFGSPITGSFGTIGYAAPEVLAHGFGSDYLDGKIDVWSLGVIFMELFAQSLNPYLCAGKVTENCLSVFKDDPATLPPIRRIGQVDPVLQHLLLRVCVLWPLSDVLN